MTHLTMRTLSTVILITMMATLSGCQWLGVYTIDIPQGTPITQTQAHQVQIGMSAEQVLQILGSPALRDTLAPNRWDYIYDYQAGTDGRRAGKANIRSASQYLSIYFDNTGRVVRIDGIGTLPKQN